MTAPESGIFCSFALSQLQLSLRHSDWSLGSPSREALKSAILERAACVSVAGQGAEPPEEQLSTQWDKPRCIYSSGLHLIGSGMNLP